jgi:PAS domain S-box-containing protein
MAAKPSSKVKSAGRKSAATPKTPPKSHAVGKKRRGKTAAATHLRSARQALRRDITERKRAEAALRESEEKYRILFQTMAQGVVYQSADGKIISVNPAAERILGLTLDQIQGRTSIDPRWRAIHEDGSDFPGQTHPAMVALQTGREVRDVVMGVYNPRTESHVWINVNAVPRIEPGDDKPCQVYTTFDDITGRKRAEEEMRRFAALPLQNPNPVLAMSLEGQLLFVSPAAARTFPTLSAEGLRHCIMADWPSVADALRRRSPPMVRREVAVDGAWYLQIFFHAAELNRVLVYLVDITDRRQAEEATRKAQAELLDERQHEKEYAEAELARMRDRLVRATRLAAIGQVSASIAHDLRNPLGTVRNAAYYLGRRLPKDQPEVAEYLGIINQEVAAADRIITNLLAVAGAKEPVKQHVDVGQAIREALARTGQAKAVRLRMSLVPEPFMVRADPDHLRQVFRNLVTNAVEAMDGGGEIVVEAARDADGDSIVLRDTGPGVAQEIRESVFEPLVTTKAKGIGLGLTICRQIIEHHGGGVELIDKDKPGAAFRIRLPRP